jgi:hypothetical protein
MTLDFIELRFLCSAWLLLAACPADDGSGGDTQSDTTDGSTAASATSPTSSTTTTSTTDATTSTTVPDTSGTTTAGEDESSTGAPLPGTCVGIDVVGTLGEVLALDDATIDTTCIATPAGCGGDIVGEWTVQSTCGWEATPNLFDDDCPGAQMTVTSGMITGTRRFNADMTFEFNVETTLELEVNLDAMTCFGADCAGYEAAAEMQPGVVAACQDTDGTCECLMTLTSPTAATGTWATAADTVVLTTAEGEGALEYCVDADRLDLWTPLTEPTPYDEPCADETDCVDALGNLSEFYVCVIE